MNSKVRQLVFAALCVALGLVLPMAFHGIPNAGTIFLPMHIPVLLSGFICGWPLSLAVGILTPAVSSILTGMPPLFILPSMICELAVYGLVSGLLYKYVRTKSHTANIYISLVGAMVAGRLVSGLLNALIFSVGTFSAQAWVTGMLVTALPGIITQLVAIPLLVRVMMAAKIIEKPLLDRADAQ